MGQICLSGKTQVWWQEKIILFCIGFDKLDGLGEFNWPRITEGHWKLFCVSHLQLSVWCNWWLVRVTLVVDWLFLPQNFGPVVGTYEGLLRLCECKWGGDSTCRWWGHLNTTCYNRTCLNFLHWEVVGNEKLETLAPLRPSLAPLCPRHLCCHLSFYIQKGV